LQEYSRGHEHEDTGMINLGIIGYGYWGPNLLRNFAELPSVNVTALADLRSSQLEIVSRRYPSIKTTAHFEDIITDKSIDAVAIATPVATHFELGMATLKSGKHLWLEKPMAETSHQAEMLVDEAQKRSLTLFVDHTFIYTGAVRKMGELVKSGDLGKILYYDSTRVNLGLFQRDVNVIADLAVHDFSILDYLLGEHPTAVTASGINHFPGTPENLAYITLFYDSGAIAHTNVSWLAPVKVRQVLLGGSKRMITYDDLEPSEKLKIYDKGVSFTDDPKQIQEMRVGYRTGDMWAPKLDGSEALRVAAEHFVDCVASGKTPVTDGKLGLRIVELIEAASSSMGGRGETIHLRRRK
jgi:predicted dehydrogenase